MRSPYSFTAEDGTTMTLADCVEALALSIAEDYSKNKKRNESMMRDCKILEVLTNALNSIKS